MASRVRDAHEARFGKAPRRFAAPGRVNLIGEHTDYNDGFVLPVAIDRMTVAAVTPNDADVVRVRSLDLGEQVDVPIDAPFRRTSSWSDYAAGVVAAVIAEHPLERGGDVTVATDLPIGGGLSSSASFELALAQALFALAGVEINPDRLAAVGRRAEHEYVGIRSGAMDQLAVAYGLAGNALFIDCRTLAVTPVAVPAGVSIAVMDTGIKHSLARSAYNQRREECERGVAQLRTAGLDITSLRDVTRTDLERHGDVLPQPLRNRVRHVVEENERTQRAVAALASGDVAELGRLMNASHESLRDLYDVSIAELDAVVSLARSVDGVYGARMTGGGFGGCAIALVDEDAAPDLLAHVTSHYYGVRNLPPAAFVTLASAGARELS
ncbi:MAG TPA: galactokinase [Candidatus Aquilonibacter sp.]|nr:galactokinase [Candidatus Aquilonibacter sp.]